MRNAAVTIILSLGILFSAVFGWFELFAEDCGSVCGEVLRLHIPANSDSAEDQTVKLLLRDRLLEEYGGLLSECGDISAAEEKAAELLPEIEEKCRGFLLDMGFSYGAKAELVTMYFTTREYDRLILPAGNYRALRITLGSGEGQNWWCVIFPQLCLPAASAPEKNSEPFEGGKKAERVLGSFGKPQRITVKFAIYEWIMGIFA